MAQLAEIQELERRCADTDLVRKDSEFLSSFLMVLPDVVVQLNSKMSRRRIPPLLASTLEHIFDPRQIAIYTSKNLDELVLEHHKGLSSSTPRGHIVQFGAGRVGYAAKHQIILDKEDLSAEATGRKPAADGGDPPGLVPELIAPMVHEGETLGVVTVGGVRRSHRDAKRLMKLVADLGSLALHNHAMISQLEGIANADSLTGLATKRYLNYMLANWTVRAQQSGSPLSVIMFDIDHFKKLNDTYGHLAGDEVLKRVALIMKGELRHDDIPSRYGGEEFVVLLPEVTKEDAARIAEKIRRAIEAHQFTNLGGPPGTVVRITISGGVSAFLIDGNRSTEVLASADQALYLAKERGRNRIVQSHIRYLSDDSQETPAVARTAENDGD
jgi:diguanylate cyclase (GGDEF)-like protein